MGTFEVTLHGDNTVTVHVADCSAVVDKRIADLRSYLECNAKVVGLDIKKLKHGLEHHAMVLCINCHCLIIRLESLSRPYPKSLDDFFQDPKICFVGVESINLSGILIDRLGLSHIEVGVEVGDLASRVLRKPALMKSSLADLAEEVGVSYNGPKTATPEIKIDSSNPKVLTDEPVVAVISDAYAYYQIGNKLLTSL